MIFAPFTVAHRSTSSGVIPPLANSIAPSVSDTLHLAVTANADETAGAHQLVISPRASEIRIVLAEPAVRRLVLWSITRCGMND